ncbi:nucleotide exchange factor GrpE [Cryobacterium sp. BB736]|uniref:nucleotide exchange factor GrpE n=1 Tax=Cryobacterium sp. BB736 TaxID=2746963 RepID=UPI001875AA80|nr:nucleotide exchange factor GrpE [Cryobacterium sp. BB736]
MADKGKDKDKEPKDEPVIRDKRRVDPETGDLREPEAKADEQASAELSEGEKLTDEDLARLLEEPVAEREPESDLLNDLKRVQAEYANYRKRVERDRAVARERAIADVISGILPLLDDLDLADKHGDLEGSPLELIAQKLKVAFEKYGLERVGEVGEPFDPNIHEAIAQLPSADATVETVADVVLPGYRIGERLLRPAKVAVTVPAG